MYISKDIIQKVAKEDMAVLAELDSQGLFCAAKEDALDFSRRLQTLSDNLGMMREDMAKKGRVEREGITVTAENRIPQDFFREAGEITSRLYEFDCQWVPGFFLTDSLGFLFGGCALSYYPDFFAMFIVRKVFKKSKKWLFYQRTELLAHELCHIARIGLESQVYEETMAYATAFTRFRRVTGGIFHKQSDVYLFLGATLLLLFGQVLKTFCFDGMPIWPFWSVLAGVFLFYSGRHILNFRSLKKARICLEGLFQPNIARAVLFRCTDDEVKELAAMALPQAREWLRKKKISNLRWRIISCRFDNQKEC